MALSDSRPRDRRFAGGGPDPRGDNRSAKPVGDGAYRFDELVADVVGLIRHLGVDQAMVVGHDWGGVVARHVAMRHPDLMARLVAINAPHPAAFARKSRSPAQLRRSCYVVPFQLPWLPEALFRVRRYAVMRRAFRREPVRTGAYTASAMRRYVTATAYLGALTEASNDDRVAVRRPSRRVRPIGVPTLVIWGEQNAHLVPALASGLEQWVLDLRVERLPHASHWVPVDAPDATNALLIDFLQPSVNR